MEHRTAFEMTTGLDEREPRQDFIDSRPRDDRRVVSLDPRTIGRRYPHRAAAERAAPLDHHSVEMWMRERDARDAPDCADRLDARSVDVAEAIPQEIAAGRTHEQRALADADRGLRSDAGQPRFQLAQLDAVTLRRELVECRPRLAALAHVLTLVLADRTALGRGRAGRLLHAAGQADVRGAAHVARRSSSSSSRTRSSRSASFAFSFDTTFAGASSLSSRARCSAGSRSTATRTSIARTTVACPLPEPNVTSVCARCEIRSARSLIAVVSPPSVVFTRSPGFVPAS